MTGALFFRDVAVRQFRNLAQLEFAPVRRLNVIAGDNGHGKTSVIEALYVLATSKSFRTESIAETISQGSDQAVIRATIDDADLVREQRVALGARSRSYRVDGKRPGTLASYATRTPVVVFHPGDLALVSGPASRRRTLLDRVALFLEPASADHRQRYGAALKQRQSVLDQRGPKAPDLEAFEAVIATHGAAFAGARRRASEALSSALSHAFAEVAAKQLALEVRYDARGSEDPARFLEALGQARSDDWRRGRASYGPQRDELSLTLEGRSARRHASQGQQRVLALSLKLAELACLREARSVHPILLMDDVSSELDPERTGAVYRFLEAAHSQVFVTTTRPELFATPELLREERADFTVVCGELSQV